MNFFKKHIMFTFISVCLLLGCAPKAHANLAVYFNYVGEFGDIENTLCISEHAEEEQSKIDSIEKIEALFKGIDIHDKSKGGRLLQIATAFGNKLVMEWLLNQGVDVNSQDDLGRSAFYYAAKRDTAEELNFLLDHGANIDMQDKNGQTPLFYCIHGEQMDFCFNRRDVSVQETLKVLLERGANVNIQDNYGNTPMHRYCYHPDKIFLLKAYGADREIKNKDGDTPLHYSIKHNRFALKLVEDFMSNEASSDIEYLKIKNNDGNTPLHLAAIQGGFEYVEYLLEKGADKNTENNDGDNPVQVSCKHIRDNGFGHEWRYEKFRELLDENFKSYESLKKIAMEEELEARKKYLAVSQ